MAVLSRRLDKTSGGETKTPAIAEVFCGW